MDKQLQVEVNPDFLQADKQLVWDILADTKKKRTISVDYMGLLEFIKNCRCENQSVHLMRGDTLTITSRHITASYIEMSPSRIIDFYE